MRSIRLRVVAPGEALYDGEVESVVMPAALGMMGILPGHAPLVSTLTPGRVSARTADGAVAFTVTGGFAEVLRDRVTILADEATPAG
jgi:F-type H+-transporting ATPase subunit epsilon